MSHSFDPDMENTNPSLKVDFFCCCCFLEKKNWLWNVVWEQMTFFQLFFLYIFCRVCVFLQPIKSMTFENIRGCCFSLQLERETQSLDGSSMVPGLFSPHIKHIWDWNKFQAQRVFLWLHRSWISGLMTTWIIHPLYFRCGLKRSGLITKVLKEKQTNYSESVTEIGVTLKPRQETSIPLHAAALRRSTKAAVQ